MGDLGDLGHGQDRAGRPGHVRQRDEAGARRDRGLERGDRPRIVAVIAGIEHLDRGRASVAERVQRADPARMLEAGRDGAVSRLPVDGQRGRVHAIRRGVGQRHGRNVGAHDRRHPGARLGHALHDVRDGVDVAAARVALPGGDLGHRGGRLGRDGADEAGIEVDPGGEGRDRGTDRGELVRIGLEGAHHGRIIRSMDGWTRPEHLATTAWLAEAVDRAGVRVVDARWRPDGSGRKLHALGHIPGAVYLDWREDLIDSEGDDQLLLAGPERVAELAGRLGIGDGTDVIVYDDSQSLFASRVWWSLRAYGLQSVRVLDGGYGAWVDEGRPISTGASTDACRPPSTPPTRTAAGCSPPRCVRCWAHRRRRCSTPGHRPSTRASKATPSDSGTSREPSTCRSGPRARPAARSCATRPPCATCSTRPT